MHARVPLLWVVDPDHEQVTICQPDQSPRTAEDSDMIDASPVFPDFRVNLRALFGSSAA